MKGLARKVAQALFAHRPFCNLICWHGPRSRPVAAVTLDDGPNAGATETVLDILRAERVRATFFVLAERVREHPDIVRRIVDEGHEVGIHGVDHWSRDFVGQVRASADELAGYGIVTRLVRPPLGRVDLKALAGLAVRRCTTVLWSFDAHDSMRGEGKWTEPFAGYEQVRGGDIVLMHDDNDICTAELPVLIASLRRRGIEPVTVSALLGRAR